MRQGVQTTTQAATQAAADAQVAAEAAARATAQALQTSTQTGSPSLVYRGYEAQREVLGEQLRNAQSQRNNLVSQLAQPAQTAATRAGLEKRIADVDARISGLDKAIIASDAAVAQAAAVPGATVRPPPPPRTGPPEEAFVLGGLFMFIVILPLSIAYARRVWRRSAKAEVRLPQEMSERMESLERGVEAIALEVERIGEGQRFVTQALADRLEPRGEKQPAYLRPGERAEHRR